MTSRYPNEDPSDPRPPGNRDRVGSAVESTDAPDCSSLLKALGNETRLGIVRALLDEPRYVYELLELLDVESTLLSQHLRVLRELEVIRFEREGKALRYSLAPGFQGRPRGRSMDFGCCRLVFSNDD